jgi:hypothetical protein
MNARVAVRSRISAVKTGELVSQEVAEEEQLALPFFATRD